MSYDRRLDHACPHLVVDEPLFLSSDRRTLRPIQPIASSASVRVRVNGSLEAPVYGSLTPAVAKGTIPGPYTIQAGVNDTLRFRVDGGPLQTLVVSPGKAITSTTLLRSLNRNATVRFSQAPRGLLQVQTASTGPGATLFLDSTSTLAPVLGLKTRKIYRGQTIVPSWSLVLDPNTLLDQPTRLIVFDAPIEGVNDFAEISYATSQGYCRRCGGVGVENDWRYDGRGEVVKVRGFDLLEQELLKITSTVQGSNGYHSWYGTRFLETIGKKNVGGVVQNLITSDIHDAFRRWQSIKKQQEEKIQQVSDEEFPFQLLGVNLLPDPSDPTILYVNAIVQSRSSKPVQITRGWRLPQPF